MPFYSGGDLQQFVDGRKSGSDAFRQRVGRTVLQALAYVHSQRIVHCDVKPANIFIQDDGAGVLGDFDVAKDNVTRSHSATATTQAQLAAGTLSYLAPECCGSTATAASDLFSFGATLFDLHFRPIKSEEDGSLRFQRPLLMDMLSDKKSVVVDFDTLDPYVNEEVDAPLRDLLRVLLARDPAERGSSLDALMHPYFLTKFENDQRDPDRDRRECAIMMEFYWRDEGVECANGHFISTDALENYVRSLSEDGVAKHNGNVQCPTFDCDRVFDAHTLAQHLTPQIFDEFMRMRRSKIEEQLQKQADERVRREVEKALREKSVDDHVKEIIETVLTLRCPRCGQAFVDFTNCFALTCSRDHCKFCAYCLVDCGRDAHAHVVSCKLNPHGRRGLFGSMDDFNSAQARRREQLLRERVMQLPPTVDRDAVLQALKPHAQRLGIEL